jgi:acyl carrier protein
LSNRWTEAVSRGIRIVTNLEKYRQAFIDSFAIEGDALAGLEYQAIPAWDSVGHMQLIALLEEAFDIMMDTDDIIDFSSFEKGREILKKYDVEL